MQKDVPVDLLVAYVAQCRCCFGSSFLSCVHKYEFGDFRLIR